jgi:hypothetical protein
MARGCRAIAFARPGRRVSALSDMETTHDNPGDPGRGLVPKPVPSRSAAAQRRAMQAALAAAVTALRSQDSRRDGPRPPSQGLG